MEETFNYQAHRYAIEVIGEGLLCAATIVVCAWGVVTNAWGLSGIFVVFGVTAIYHFWNVFIAHCHPSRVCIDDSRIIFHSFGHDQSYLLRELESFRVREYPSTGRMYLRVGRCSLLRGRFWIATKSFANGSELFDRIRAIEAQVHPTSLKEKARRTNEAYIQAFGYGRHKKKR